MTAADRKRVVAVDTMVLVWALQKSGTPEEHVAHAGYLFKQLEDEKAEIVIPTVVVAEFIAPIKAEERGRVVGALNERFRIEPFDMRDVVTAAELWDAGKSGRPMKQPNARMALRADCLIVATAKNHGASVFYTEDDACFAMAAKVMEAKRLPTIAPSLFDLTR